MSTENMTYAGVGVNYAANDPFKVKCQKRAARTEGNARRLGFEAIPWSRGESVFLLRQLIRDNLEKIFGLVEEGLGTKNLVADIMRRITGKTYYDQSAQCTVAMIVNDKVTLAVFPAGVAMHLAVGESKWFDDEKRSTDLVNGWGDACDKARCVWVGGETPTLKGIIVPGTALLSGSAFGLAKNNHPALSPERITPGDAIVFIESSGIHANGLSLARAIAEKLAKGLDTWWRKVLRSVLRKLFRKFELAPSDAALLKAYATPLPSGRMYGEVLLDPTHIYVGVVEDALDRGIRIHYAVNITGHGWRKLMRAEQKFAYIIDTLPSEKEIFPFLQRHGPVDDYEAYGNLNMGAGFALYMPEADVARFVEIAANLGLVAFRAGHIERSEEKKVVIKPKNLVYTAETLAVR